MTTAERLSNEEIESMNLALVSQMTAQWQEEESNMGVPEEDLAIFFRLAPGKSMLDVGCGWGRYVEHFIAHGMEYTGIDKHPDALAVAQQRHPSLRFEVASYHDLEARFGYEAFDALWCCCVFGGEPKRRMPEALEQMRGVLVPEGIVYFVLPLSFESDEYVENVSETEVAFFAQWRLEEFKQAVHDAGFKVVYGIQRFKDGSMTVVGKKI